LRPTLIGRLEGVDLKMHTFTNELSNQLRKRPGTDDNFCTANWFRLELSLSLATTFLKRPTTTIAPPPTIGVISTNCVSQDVHLALGKSFFLLTVINVCNALHYSKLLS